MVYALCRSNTLAPEEWVKFKTTRFGEIEVNQQDIIKFKEGILGFEQYKNFTIVDPNDTTLIMWMQSVDAPQIAFPIIEPQIFKPDYCPVLMPTDMNSIELQQPMDAKVYTILTIPSDFTQMNANLKAPIVINLKKNIAKQIVLQDNKLTVGHEMYRDLKRAISSFATSDDLKRTTIAPIKSFNPDMEISLDNNESVENSEPRISRKTQEL